MLCALHLALTRLWILIAYPGNFFPGIFWEKRIIFGKGDTSPSPDSWEERTVSEKNGGRRDNHLSMIIWMAE
jgi:hypothetical protein